MVQAPGSMTDDPWFDSWKRKAIFPSPKCQDLPSRPIFKVYRGERRTQSGPSVKMTINSYRVWR